VFPPILLGLRAAPSDFPPPRHVKPPLTLQVLKSDFTIAPAMRKYCIEWDLRPEELMELKRSCIQEAHDSRSRVEIAGACSDDNLVLRVCSTIDSKR
jgi:hypothetical protein